MFHLGFSISICGWGLIIAQVLGLGFGLDLSEHSPYSSGEWLGISILAALGGMVPMAIADLTRR